MADDKKSKYDSRRYNNNEPIIPIVKAIIETVNLKLLILLSEIKNMIIIELHLILGCQINYIVFLTVTFFNQTKTSRTKKQITRSLNYRI